MGVIDELQSAARAEILSEKALRYKRAAMALALVIFAVHVAPIDFDNVNFAGVRFDSSVSSRRTWTLSVLWGFLTYQIAWASYFCWRDWRRWRDTLLDRWPGDVSGVCHFFPELAMYWGRLPSEATTNFKISNRGGFVGWVLGSEQRGRLMEYHPEFNEKTGKVRRSGFSVPMSIVREVREKWRSFWWLEIGAAAACVLLAVSALIWEVLPWG